MKNYNKILEAVNRGIKFALDDFEDNEEIQGQTNSKVKYKGETKEWLDLMNTVVDFGLPSGTLWCRYNLGVNSDQLSEPEDWYGKYYAWGELVANKSEFKWDYYRYCRGSYDEITKYNSKPMYGYNNFCDNLTELLPEDDAAYYNNFNFHIPTKKQFDELLYYTSHVEINDYNGIKGLNGYKFVNNVKGNMVALFIPYAGFCHNNEIINSDKQGWYWSSTLYQENNTSYAAHCLHFDLYHYKVGTAARSDGLTIRPVVNL